VTAAQSPPTTTTAHPRIPGPSSASRPDVVIPVRPGGITTEGMPAHHSASSRPRMNFRPCGPQAGPRKQARATAQWTHTKTIDPGSTRQNDQSEHKRRHIQRLAAEAVYYEAEAERWRGSDCPLYDPDNPHTQTSLAGRGRGPGSRKETCHGFFQNQTCPQGLNCTRVHVEDLQQAKDSRPHVPVFTTDRMRDQYRQWRNERGPLRKLLARYEPNRGRQLSPPRAYTPGMERLPLERRGNVAR
jgi:hypothetical protein